MAVQFARKNSEEKPTLSQALSNFFMAHRKVLIASVAAVFVVVIAIVVVAVTRQSGLEKAYQSINDLMEEWSALSASEASDADAESRIITSLEDIASSNKRNFAGARANMSAAEICFAKEDWDAAKGFYDAAAAVSAKYYTTGYALYNAAVCAEELGLLDEASSLFERAEACASFPQKARCRFNIARIQEKSAGAAAALESYRTMIDLYPSSQWTDLARSRIIALEIAQGNN